MRFGTNEQIIKHCVEGNACASRDARHVGERSNGIRAERIEKDAVTRNLDAPLQSIMGIVEDRSQSTLECLSITFRRGLHSPQLNLNVRLQELCGARIRR